VPLVAYRESCSENEQSTGQSQEASSSDENNKNRNNQPKDRKLDEQSDL